MRSNTDQQSNYSNSKFKFMLLGCLRWSSTKAIKVIMTLRILVKLWIIMNNFPHQAHWLDPSHWLDSTWPKARIVIAGTAAVLVLVLLIILSKIIRSLCCCCCDWRPQLVKTNDTIHSSIQAQQTTQAPPRPQHSPISQNVCDPRLLLLLSPKHEGE